MKNYKSIIISSFLVMAIIASPAISFAKENENKIKNSNQEREMERERDQKQEKSSWFSSWFGNKSKKNISTVPTISNLSVISVKKNKAVINWNTDVKSNSMVWYSTSPSVDTSGSPSMKRNDRTLKHKFEINKLQPNTTYYLIVGGATNGGIGKSGEISFKTGTLVNNVTVPVISSVTGPASGKTGETLSYVLTASDPQNKALTYSIDWGDENKISSTSFTSNVTVTHTYNKLGTYAAKFTVTNTDGKKATYPVKIVISGDDTVAPIVSEIETKVSGKNVSISWKTNEPSNSTVFYSTTTPLDVNASGTLKVENNSLVTKHEIAIPNLASNTLYHFILKSVDASNNATSTTAGTFATN